MQTVFDLRSGGRNGQVSGRVERRGGHCVKAGHGGFRDNDAELGDAGRAGGPVERDPQVAAIAEVVDVDHIGERCGRQTILGSVRIAAAWGGGQGEGDQESLLGQSAACRASVVDRGAAAYGRRSSSEERREAAVADGEPLKKVMDRSVGHVNGHVGRGCPGDAARKAGSEIGSRAGAHSVERSPSLR